MAKILLVDDDVSLCDVVEQALKEEQHVVETVYSGNEALDRLRLYFYDAVILDWSLPEKNGLEICKSYRARGGNTRILMLTGKTEINDKEAGLDAGADDYLTKPFSMRELAARIRALLRRPVEVGSPVVKLGFIEVDSGARKVRKDGVEIVITPKEFTLLEFLVRHPNQVFSSEALIERLWSNESDTSPDILCVYVTRLRKKLERDGHPSVIRTVYGEGYCLEMNEESSKQPLS